MNVGIIDGQGAGIGQTLIKRLRKDINKDKIYIYALATNKIAAENMLKSGADEAIYGERAICKLLNSNKLNSIIGPIGILCIGGINGEITSMISKYVFAAPCKKYLLPLHVHGLYIPGTNSQQLKDLIDEIIENLKEQI
jgi:hypothetical protein